MIRDQIRRFGCGMNKIKTGADIRHCIENGLDYNIYRLGRYRIKMMIQRRHGIELSIEAKTWMKSPEKLRQLTSVHDTN